MKGVLPWLEHCACLVSKRDFCSALAALVGPVQNIFLHRTMFQCLCAHRPASWAGSRAGSPALSMRLRVKQLKEQVHKILVLHKYTFDLIDDNCSI